MRSKHLSVDETNVDMSDNEPEKSPVEENPEKDAASQHNSK